MRIESNQLFIPLSDVESHLPDHFVQEYFKKGILVAVDVYSSKKGDEHYGGRHISKDSLETIMGLDEVSERDKQKLKSVLSTGAATERFLDSLVDHNSNYKLLFITPQEHIDDLNSKPKQSTPRERIENAAELEKALWVSTQRFFESLRVQGGVLPPTQYKAFVLALYEGIGIHPFVNEQGTWCYTVADTEKIRTHLKLPPSERVPKINRADPLKGHDASSVGTYGLGNGRKGSRLGSE